MMGACSVRSRSGQMAVEVAVALPVALALLLVVVNTAAFLERCARFDSVAAQCVVGVAAAAEADAYSALPDAIQTEIERCMGEDDRASVSVEVASGGASGFLAGATVYRCTLTYLPWPAPGAAFSAGGVTSGRIGRLVRVREFATAPYRPGSVL